MDAPPRRNRPARSRREQALRAEARTVSRLLRGVAQLQAHRGSQPSRLGAALALALREATAPSGQADTPFAKFTAPGAEVDAGEDRPRASDTETVHADLAAAQAEEPASSASELPAAPPACTAVSDFLGPKTG